MFSVEQKRKAEQSKVTKVDESQRFVYFKVVYVNQKGEHEHQVSFDKTTKKFSCDCSWCSFYGFRPKSRNKRCYNVLAVMNKLSES